MKILKHTEVAPDDPLGITDDDKIHTPKQDEPDEQSVLREAVSSEK